MFRALVSVIGPCILAAPAWAQSAAAWQDDFLAPAEIAAAVTLQAPGNVSRPDFGGALLVAVYASRSLAVIGETGVYRDNGRSVRASLGGIRVRTPGLISDGKSRGRFLAQLMIGEQESPGLRHRLAVQPGAGGDAYLRRGLLVHFEYDYRWVPGARRNLSTGRLLWALGIQIGSHS